MADVFSPEERSEIMRRVRSSKNKSTELKLISVFRMNHITGWRRNYNVKGHPDFVFLKTHTAVFVDGCFWHGHNCRNTTPRDNAEYWEAKISRNKRRDEQITAYFTDRGWKVIRIWECELQKKNHNILINKILPLFPDPPL